MEDIEKEEEIEDKEENNDEVKQSLQRAKEKTFLRILLRARFHVSPVARSF